MAGISREAEQATGNLRETTEQAYGAVESFTARNGSARPGQRRSGRRTALRIWIASDGLFARDAEGIERLPTPADAGSTRQWPIWFAILATVPWLWRVRGEPGGRSSVPRLVSMDRAQAVRDYLPGWFLQQATLTGIMPMSDEAVGSPRGDNRWSGALVDGLAAYLVLTPHGRSTLAGMDSSIG